MKAILHAKQGIVFQSSSRFKVVAAGRRFGKTSLAAVILFFEALKNPNGIYWLVAPTYGQAKELAWNILVKLIRPEVLARKPNESDLNFKLKNGAEIHLKGADNPDTLVGRGLRGLVIDEVARIRNHKRVWEEILRPSLADFQGFCLFISTPQGKDYFWDLWMKGQRKEEGYESWQFKTLDNPFIPKEEVEAAKATCSDRYFRQEYEASFEDFSGAVWPEFDERLHVIEPIEIPGHWERIGAIDPAVTGTTAVLFSAIDEDGSIYITGEFYKQNQRASEVAQEIKGKAVSWLMDPAGRKKELNRDGKLFSFFDEYGDSGIYPSNAQNDVNAGINRVAEYFKLGKIKIFKGCKNLLYELERYHWSEERETVTGLSEPKPYKSQDHACDALRYLVMSRFSTIKPEKKAAAGTWAEREEMNEEALEKVTDEYGISAESF